MSCGTSRRENLRAESENCRHFRFVVGLAPVSASVGEENKDRERQRERGSMSGWVAAWLSTRDDPTQIVTANQLRGAHGKRGR